jgi:hypothetical protein
MLSNVINAKDLVDKSSWPVGPWSSEPDFVEWVDEVTEYRCLIQRVPELGHLCGYVGVREDHMLYGMTANDRIEAARANIELRDNLGIFDIVSEACSDEPDGTVSLSLVLSPHGGVTWASTIDDYDEWFFGFDCGHAGDKTGIASPMISEMQDAIDSFMSSFGVAMPQAVYRDIEYVAEECRLLAGKLKSRE